ncbi:AAA family ATPase [Gemmatimonas sp.]|jgi:predicted ATP-dependent serine protease|uniref:AAA family ATPase n=1 Tax=Gemmatimonas sp. TaxID=1962908 RepID=UPI003F6F06AE
MAVEQPQPLPSRPALPHQFRARSASALARDKRIKPAVPLVPGLLYRGRFTLLVAPAKMGKTTVVWHTISGLAKGQPVFGYQVPPCRILVLALEEALGDTKERVLEQGLHKHANVFILDAVDAPGFRPFDVLEANVEVLQPEVIVVDTLSSYAAGQVTDENNSMAWMTILPEISKLAHRRDIALLVLHHAQKSGGGARGSTQIVAVPDNLAFLSQPKGQPDNVRCLSWKGRQSRTGSAFIAYDIETTQYTTVDQSATSTAEGSEMAGRRVSATEPATERVLRLIQARTHPNGPRYRELRSGAKMKAERVDAALKSLVDRGKVRKSRDGRATRYGTA